MTRAKHTPAPWRTEKTDVTTVLIIDSGGAIVADVNSGSTFRKLSDKQYANASLIAAAPELLSCLIDAVGDDDSLQNPWRVAARAAIAKATGGAA